MWPGEDALDIAKSEVAGSVTRLAIACSRHYGRLLPTLTARFTFQIRDLLLVLWQDSPEVIVLKQRRRIQEGGLGHLIITCRFA